MNFWVGMKLYDKRWGIPVGAKGNLCSSSERSALIRLLSDEARQCGLPERLSTLLPLERGWPGLKGSPWNAHKHGFYFWVFLNDAVYVWLCRLLTRYLWFVRELDGVVAAWGVGVLHVDVVLVAGTCVVYIWAWIKQIWYLNVNSEHFKCNNISTFTVVQKYGLCNFLFFLRSL